MLCGLDAVLIRPPRGGSGGSGRRQSWIFLGIYQNNEATKSQESLFTLLLYVCTRVHTWERTGPVPWFWAGTGPGEENPFKSIRSKTLLLLLGDYGNSAGTKLIKRV